MRYSDEIIEEVRMKNDIVEVISGYVRLTKKGSGYFGLCPFHNEKTPSFSVSPQRQMYHCFGCGAGGNVITFIMESENYSFPEALKFLADRAGIALPQEDYSEDARKKADLHSKLLEVNKLAAGYYYAQLKSENGKKACDYLARRGISPDIIKKFGLGYSNGANCDLHRFLKSRGYSDEIMREAGLISINERKGASDMFRDRVMFPIMDANSRVLGFGGRVMGGAGPKYLNTPETMVFNKRRNLYGINRARTAKKPYFLLCEGYMDVIALHQAGFSNAVASLGTALTTGQAFLIKRYARQAYLVYDSDAAGTRAAIAAVPVLRGAGIYARVVITAPYKDPDEFIRNLSPDEFEKRIASSEDGFMFTARQISDKYKTDTPEGKTAFTRETADRLAEIEDEIERVNYAEAVAKEYDITAESFKRLVAKKAASDQRAAQAPRAVTAPDRKRESGIKISQKILLTYLSEDEGLYEKIKGYIEPDDFTEGLYRRAAQLLFAQLAQGKPDPAKVIDHFTSDEEHREAAALFNTRIRRISGGPYKERAVKETMQRVKAYSIDTKMRMLSPSDIAGLQRLAYDKQKLADIDKLHISFD